VRGCVALVLLLAAACAAPGTGSPRISFADALQQGREPDAAPELDRALDAFARATRSSRQQASAGAPMGERHAAAWASVLSALDGALARADTLSLAKARVVLQAELDADTGTFGDVPPALAERIVGAVRALSGRLSELSARGRHAQPAGFAWPTNPVIVTSAWGDRVHPIHGDHRFHAGVDLAGELGQEVRAADAGTVVFAGWNGAHGKQLELMHDAHLATRYSHLMTLLVRPGQAVRRGEVIALVGDTGASTGPHLHFELRRDGEALDPQAQLPAPALARAWPR
jgi:murein DD-endopeptidase MepM/ murein hydrolase activator NlpD